MSRALLFLLLAACGDKAETPCADLAFVLKRGEGRRCRADQHIEWGPVTLEDDGIGGACVCDGGES